MDDKTRASADARFKKALRPDPPASGQRAEARLVDARTAKLRAARLERDGPVVLKPRKSVVRKTGVKKGIGSY